MPRWNIEVPQGILTMEEKQTLATNITNLYVSLGLPKFLINVLISEHPVGAYFGGAKTPAKGVFFIISHAAGRFTDEEHALQFHGNVDKIVRPVFEPKGLKWEYNIYQQSADHWRVNGMVPPLPRTSKAFRRWVEEDQPTPYSEDEVKL